MIAKHLAAAHALRRAQAAVAEFWTRADCRADTDACWPWRGRTDRTGRAVIALWRADVHAVRVAAYAVTGDYPTAPRFNHVCGNACCVRPSHVRWSTSPVRRREIAAYSDGYGREPGAVDPASECAAAVAWSRVRLAS
jgi:hypothetical protein